MAGIAFPCRPMLAVEADRPFSDARWLFEVKWDGIRCICRGGRMWTRRGVEVGDRFPEVVRGLPAGAALDGELVVPVAGRPDFDAVMDRFRMEDRHRIGRAAESRPAALIAFDRPDLAELPQTERRARLLEAVRPGPALRVNPAVDTDGLALWEVVRQQEWEGVVAKRKDAMYRFGERSPAWRKIKNRRVLDAVVTGAYGDGYLVVAEPSHPDRPVATVNAGVPATFFRAVRDGSVALPAPCRVAHVGRTHKGRLREPVLLPS